MLEELASGCTGMSNLVGVHYLGIATLCASWNMRLMNKLMRDTVEGEKTGVPCLISLAITEPDAGSDVEEVDLVSRPRSPAKPGKWTGATWSTGARSSSPTGTFPPGTCSSPTRTSTSPRSPR